MTSVGFDMLGLLALSCAGMAGARYPIGRIVVYGGCLLVCLSLGANALSNLANPAEAIILPIGMPSVGMHLRLDELSDVFLGLLALGGAGASLFALGYARHELQPGRVLPFYPAFLAAMILVLAADDAFTFLFGWEAMSLLSWALVMAHQGEGRAAEDDRPGIVYLVMAAFSGLALLVAFGLLAGVAGTYTFDVIRETPHGALLSSLVLIVTLVGAGSKAGLIPFHVWLPLAHPAAPTHVSALMSGVMTKVAVYGFIRIVFDLVGANVWWAGIPVLALGGLTAVLGVLQAVTELDLKRLLAYSTIENIGILFIGLGLTLAFRANGFPVVAALALTATLFHAVNHTLMKSLLFFGAGAVLAATAQRSLNALGGLIRLMPRTSVAVLVGCAAMAALPPLNGFASEWLLFQTILLHPELPQWGLKLMIPVAGALLALAASLAGACFVRVFGIAFLGRPRSDASAQARETDGFSQLAMGGFAALCLLGGIVPGVVIDALAPVAQLLTGARMPIQLSDTWLSIVPVAASRSSYNGLLVFIFIISAILVGVALVGVVALRDRPTRRAPLWDCGYAEPAVTVPNMLAGHHLVTGDHLLAAHPLTPEPLVQVSASSFAQPLRQVYGTILLGARSAVVMPAPGDAAPARITHVQIDPAWHWIYHPLTRAIGRLSDRANVLQFLTIRRYLGLVFAALVLLLLVLTAWQ